MLVTDRDGTIGYVNPAVERVYGYSREELLGRSVRLFTADTMPVEVYEDIWRRLRAGEPRLSTFPNRKKDGELYEEEIAISPLRNGAGEIAHYLWIGRPAGRKTTMELFTRLADSSPAAVAVFREGKFVFVNEQFKLLSGYTGRELWRLEPLTLVHADDRELVAERRASPSLHPYEYRLIAKDGQVRWVLESVARVDFLSLGGDDTPYLAGTMVDITAWKTAEEQLQYALTLYAATVESTTDAIIVVDTRRVVRHYNRRFREMWRLPEGEEFVGGPGARLFQHMLGQVKQPDDLRVLGRDVFLSQEEVRARVEMRDGRLLAVRTSPQLIDGEVAGQVWSFRDITEQVRMEATLTDLANLDSLTGIPNRRRFQEEVNAAISRGEHGAILFMDVDDFKAINDSLGHTAGDEFLRSLAQCLSESLRPGDMLARLGGDEFAVLLRGAGRGEAMAVGQRLLQAAREMRTISAQRPLSSTISIGGALFPAHGASVDELLGHADLAMYEAKHEGRNGLQLYHAGLGSKSASSSRVLWKQKILDALENDRFVLYGQPIFELKTNRLACYELLLRLREPNGALVYPGRFLPLAEQSGLAHQIDSWVIQQGLLIAQQLSTAPRKVNVSFNISAVAVGNAELLELFKREAARLDINPRCVSIEVTETALISDLPKARLFLRSLKELGFRFALDDFGAGFSSFSRLREVRADYLKVPGGFITEIVQREEDRHVVRAIADLASGLGIGAVAESVQSAEVLDVLMELGVKYGQGSFLGPTRPIERVLEAHGARRLAA